jgi:hypothetical protein
MKPRLVWQALLEIIIGILGVVIGVMDKKKAWCPYGRKTLDLPKITIG